MLIRDLFEKEDINVSDNFRVNLYLETSFC